MNNITLNIFAVFVGSGIGAVCRYLISLIKFSTQFPCSTLLVNIFGSLIFGFVYAYGVQKLGIPLSIQLLLLTGFCGGLSTMSSFSFESLSLFEQGLYWHFVLNLILSFTLPLLAVVIGVYCGKQI